MAAGEEGQQWQQQAVVVVEAEVAVEVMVEGEDWEQAGGLG
jgi:hypothetical protein